MPVLLQGVFKVEPPKFSECILYPIQNMFSPYACCTHMCNMVARFYGQYLPEIYTTFQLENEGKKSKFQHFKYKRVCELSNVCTPDNEYYLFF